MGCDVWIDNGQCLSRVLNRNLCCRHLGRSNANLKQHDCCCTVVESVWCNIAIMLYGKTKSDELKSYGSHKEREREKERKREKK